MVISGQHGSLICIQYDHFLQEKCINNILKRFDLHIIILERHLEEARKAGFQVLRWNNSEGIQALKERLRKAGIEPRLKVKLKEIQTEDSLLLE